MNELAFFVGIGVEYEFAGVSHDFLGDGLSVAEMGEFGFVLGSAFHHPHIEIAGESDPGLLDHVGVDQRQGSVRSDAGDVVLYQAFGKGLGGGDFAIARKPFCRSEVGGAIKLVGAGRFLGAGDLNIAEDEDTLSGGELDVGSRIANSEANSMEEREVRLGDTREDGGVGTGGIVGHGGRIGDLAQKFIVRG